MNGEKIVITKHGTNRALKKLRKKIAHGKGLSIKEMTEEGRK